MTCIIPLILLLQDELKLEHRAVRGQSVEVHQVVRFGIAFKGDEDWAERLRALSPLLSIQDFVLDAEATHEVVRAPKDGAAIWRVKYGKAKVHGLYDDEKFEYVFSADRKEEPGEDKLKAMVYSIYAGGRSHKVTRSGEMEDFDPNKDPNGEALDLICYPLPRFQDKAVKAGDSWTNEWLSRTKDKDSGYRIKFKQTVTLEKIEDKIAHLKVVLGGEIQKAEGAKGFAHTVTPKAESSVRFDLDKGQVVAYDSTGEVDVHIKGTDPNSTDEIDVHLILKGQGKLEPR